MVAGPDVQVLREVVGDFTITEFRFSNTLLAAVGQAILKGVIRNTRGQVTATGQRQKTNAPSTRRRKRALGRPQRSLRDDPAELRLTSLSKFDIEVGKNAVAVAPQHKDVSEGVQEKGYVGWLAPDKKAIDDIKYLIVKAITAAAKRAAAKRKKERL